MNIAEQIKAFTVKREEIMARKSAIMEKAAEDGRTLEEEESAEYDSLDTELKAVDDHLKRLGDLEVKAAEGAKPVSQSNSVKSTVNAPNVFIKKQDPDEKFQGQNYTRRCIAKAMASLSDGELSPGQVAEQRWGKSHPKLVEVIKSGVAGGGSAATDWGEELVQLDGRYAGDFIEYLKSKTVYDQLPLREVPHNVVISGQDGIGTGYWVGEAKAIPASAQDFSEVSLTPLKVAAISVISNELIRDSSPSAEMLVRDGLVEAAAQRIDQTFLSAAAASAAVSPAGLLNGLTSLGSNGITADALRQDVKELYAPFLAASNAMGLQFVMTPTLAKAIQLLYNALGQPEFNNIGTMGGTLLGDPVVTGDNVGATTLILLKPSDIWKIGDLGIQVSLSREATIEQDDAPQGDSEAPTAASATLMSMFQTESTAFKIVRPMNFQKRRSHAVQFIGDAQYGTTGATTA